MRRGCVVTCALLVVLACASSCKRFRREHGPKGAKCGPAETDRKRNPNMAGCKSDDDCKAGPNGRCIETGIGHARAENRCQYDECFTDDDCRKGGLVDGGAGGSDEMQMLMLSALGDGGPPGPTGPCECGANGWLNRCASGDCATNADCAGRTCAPSTSFDCGSEGGRAWHCHTPNDLCEKDSDCADGGRGASCRYDSNKGRWACSDRECHVY